MSNILRNHIMSMRISSPETPVGLHRFTSLFEANKNTSGVTASSIEVIPA